MSDPVQTTEKVKVKDLWDKLHVVGTLVGSIAIPVVVVLIGFMVNASLKESETRSRLVELAVGILQEDPKNNPETPALREWAITIINKYSGVPMSASVREELRRTPLPSSRVSTLGGIGTLDIRSDPPGAEIYIDGRSIGFTNKLFAIGLGPHKIEVRSSGKTKVFNVEIAPGASQTIYARF